MVAYVRYIILYLNRVIVIQNKYSESPSVTELSKCALSYRDVVVLEVLRKFPWALLTDNDCVSNIIYVDICFVVTCPVCFNCKVGATSPELRLFVLRSVSFGSCQLINTFQWTSNITHRHGYPLWYEGENHKNSSRFGNFSCGNS